MADEEKRLTHTDVALLALAGRMRQIRKAKPSRYCMHRACFALREYGKDKLAEKLHALTLKMWPPKEAHRKSPIVGELRDYRVLVQDEILCSRIPTALLGIQKGDKVTAGFGVIDKKSLNSGRFIFLFIRSDSGKDQLSESEEHSGGRQQDEAHHPVQREDA